MNIKEIKEFKEDAILKMFDKNELRRLERCIKDKNKNKVFEWGQEFERRLNEEFNKQYKERYINVFRERLKDLDIAVIYALHFNENTKFGNKRLKDFMDDLAATMRGFYQNEFSRDEYEKMLEDDGIKLAKD